MDNRIIKNESVILDLLSKYNNFQIIDYTDPVYENFDQIYNVYKQCRCMIGIHSSSMFNCIFSNNCDVIEIPYKWDYLRHVSNILNRNHFTLDVIETHDGYVVSDIGITELCKYLAKKS
jgi:capsular polysaccharide biosynthesis protein